MDVLNVDGFGEWNDGTEGRVKPVVFNLFNLTDDADFKFLSKHI